jgi:hypothetical protein
MSSDDVPVHFPTDSQLIKLSDAAHLPVLRAGGRPCSLATLYRWALKGVDGVILRTVVTHRGLMTTAADVDAFVRARVLVRLKRDVNSGASGKVPAGSASCDRRASSKRERTEMLAKQLFPVPKSKIKVQN